jgi:hypothetical protein
MGVFEMEAFAKGTFAIAHTLADLTAKVMNIHSLYCDAQRSTPVSCVVQTSQCCCAITHPPRVVHIVQQRQMHVDACAVFQFARCMIQLCAVAGKHH